ncbi:hypothetical protein BDV30DRAFT_215134 [Aspergillus minisclerotigenes]|uniref:Uncharacterized protein n=1 Tax=Aspergillus minisclerotigenes TaxID=656917 RepID=A0A5N6IUT3_9EURO|nr:hypothetical protein BDV30DRAFT_215134 [Aspergillus minisclerotigenes]
MTYVFDKVLSPPQTPLSTNIPGDTISEKEALPEHFDGHLSAGWKVVYRQDYEQHQKVFLCSNWAYLRLKDELKPNQMFPYDDQDPDDTTGYTVDEYVKKLDREFGLVVCDFDDPARISIIWSPGGSPKSVGHIQVKYDGNWESKISTEYWVITHGEDDFQHLTNGNLVKMQAFKRR